MLLLIALPALAAPYITHVGDAVPLTVGGGWPRANAREDGTWDFLWSAGGDYNRLPMSADLAVVDRDRQSLTGRTDLVDHGLAACPDGTWLHVASGNVDDFNDSAWAFRYDADFELVATATVEERVSDRAHNDMAVICAPGVQGVTFITSQGGAVFIPLDADAAPGEETSLPDAPRMTGGSLAWEAERGTFVAMNFDQQGTLQLVRYSAALEAEDAWSLELLDPPQRGYWAQGALRVGQHWLLAHMARDDDEGWAADEGDVWVHVLDLDWNVLESHQVSFNTPPTGGMRPGLARMGDQVLVLYDVNVAPVAYALTIDEDAFGPDPEAPDDEGETGLDYPPPAGEGCGCATTGAGTGWLGLAGLLLAWRRRCSAR